MKLSSKKPIKNNSKKQKKNSKSSLPSIIKIPSLRKNSNIKSNKILKKKITPPTGYPIPILIFIFLLGRSNKFKIYAIVWYLLNIK